MVLDSFTALEGGGKMKMEVKESPFCHVCGGHHELDTHETWVDFEGYRFKSPFLCMCCGQRICARQFAFGRCCGTCAMGACQFGQQANIQGRIGFWRLLNILRQRH